MAKFSHIQNSFKSGLLSDKLRGRTDIQEYRNGCLQLNNFIPFKSGGVGKKPGSQFLSNILTAEDPDTITLPPDAENFGVIPFIVNKESSYTIVFITDDTNDVDSSSYRDILIYDSSGNVVEGLSGTNLRVAGQDLDPSKFDFVQSSDVLFIVHSSGLIPPVTIQRTDASTDTFEIRNFFAEAEFQTKAKFLSLPFRPVNLDPEKVLQFNTGSPATLTAEDSGGSAIDLFDSSMASDPIPTFFKFNDGSNTTVLEVDTFNSSSEVEVSVVEGPTPSDGTTTDDWSESSWSEFRGYPRTVTIYQQRILFGGCPGEPDTVFNSTLGNFYILMQNKLLQDSSSDSSGLNYFGSLESSDAFSFSIGSTELNDITWMNSVRNLHVGTLGAEFIVVEPSNAAYGPLNLPYIRPQTYHGSSPVKSSKYGTYSLYVSRNGKRIRDFSYSENNGSNVSRDLSILSDQAVYHNFSSGSYSNAEYKEIYFQQDKSVLWCLTTLGQLLGITMSTSGETVAWHSHTFGGTDVEIQSICVTPNEDGSGEDLYLIIKRTIDSSDTYYLERVGAFFEHPNLYNSSENVDDTPYFSDSSIKVVNSPASTTVSGLGHLEGEEVQILADGEIQEPKTVSSGEITLDTAAEEIIVGLKYTSTLETMPLEAGAVIGNSQILLKRVDHLLMKLYKSLEGQYYYTEGSNYPVEYPDVASNETFSGVSRVDFDSTNDYEYSVKIKHDKPVPFNLLALIFRGFTKD